MRFRRWAPPADPPSGPPDRVSLRESRPGCNHEKSNLRWLGCSWVWGTGWGRVFWGVALPPTCACMPVDRAEGPIFALEWRIPTLFLRFVDLMGRRGLFFGSGRFRSLPLAALIASGDRGLGCAGALGRQISCKHFLDCRNGVAARNRELCGLLLEPLAAICADLL